MAFGSIPSIAPRRGLGKPTGAVNLCTNGGFETNTAGWATSGTNTIARSVEHAKSGAASCKITFSNDVLYIFYNAIITAAAHTISMWIYLPTAFDGAGLDLSFESYAGASPSATVTTAVNMGLRDQWQRVAATLTPVAGDVNGYIAIRATGAAATAGRFIYVDDAQVERGSVATPCIATGKNLVINSSWETNLTGSVNESPSTPTRTRDTTEHLYGVASQKVVTPGSIPYEGVNIASVSAISGTQYTASVWAKGVAGVNYRFLLFGAGIPTTIITGTFTGAWQRLVVTATSGANGLFGPFLDTGAVAAATTFYIDGVQIELGAVATDYDAFKNDDGTATRPRDMRIAA